MQGWLGPNRAPAEDYAEDRRAGELFMERLRAACARGKETEPTPLYVPPEIPRRENFTFPEIDQGPNRATLTNVIALNTHRTAERTAAISATVALVTAMTAQEHDHQPWKRPKIGRFSITDLGNHDCRFPMTEQGPHFFCGADVVEGLPYCNLHAVRCFKWSARRAG